MSNTCQRFISDRFLLSLYSLLFFFLLVLLALMPAVSSELEAHQLLRIKQALQDSGSLGIFSSFLMLVQLAAVQLLEVQIDPLASVMRIFSLLAAAALLISGIVLAERCIDFPDRAFRRRLYFFYFLIFASSFGYLQFAGEARSDMFAAFLINIAWLSILLPQGATLYPALRWRWYALAGLSSTGAVILSSPIAIAVILVFSVSSLTVLLGLKIALRESLKVAVVLLFLGALAGLCQFALRGSGIAQLLSHTAQLLSQLSKLENYPEMFGLYRVETLGLSDYFSQIFEITGFWIVLSPWCLWLASESVCKLAPYAPAPERSWSAALLWAVSVAVLLPLFFAPQSSAFYLALLPCFALSLSIMISSRIDFGTEWLTGFWVPRLYRASVWILSATAIAYLLLLGFAQSPYTGWSARVDALLAYLWVHAGLIFFISILALLSCRIAFKQNFSPAYPLAVSMLIALPIYLAAEIRAGHQGFPDLAQKIQAQLEQQRLNIIQTEDDHSLDPLLYYLQGDFEVQYPEKKHLTCPGLYLSTEEWLESSYSSLAHIVVIGRFATGVYRESSGQSRAVVLFRCIPDLPQTAI